MDKMNMIHNSLIIVQMNNLNREVLHSHTQYTFVIVHIDILAISVNNKYHTIH